MTRYNVPMEVIAKLRIRPIGNSLGVVIPRTQLQAWGVSEGDELELTEHGITVPKSEHAQARLDEAKRLISAAVVAYFPPERIRQKSAENLQRWKVSGAWCSAYDEWVEIIAHASNAELLEAMLGHDDRANRLRQSMPYVGLLPQDEVRRIRAHLRLA